MIMLNIEFNNIKELKKFIDKNNILNSNQTFIQIFYSQISNEKLVLKIKDELLKILPESSIMGTSTAGIINNTNIERSKILISFSLFEKSYTTQNSYTNQTIPNIIKDLKKNIIKKNSKLLIIFANTYTFNANELIESITKEFPKLIVAGGNSGDDFNFKKGLVFTKENNVDVAITSINSDELYINTNYLLNWQTIGQTMTITKCDNNIIYEIDDKKAVEVYEDFLGKDMVDYLVQSGMGFPLIYTKNHIEIARACIGLGKNGSIIVAGSIEEGTRVKFGFANIDIIEQDNMKNLEEKDHNAEEGMYIYSCAVRKKLLDEFLDDELKLLNSISNSTGFLTYGEFYHDSQNCLNSLLNITTTYVTLSENKTQPIRLRNITCTHKSNANMTLKALTHLINKTTQTSHLLEQYKNTVDMNAMVSKTDINGKITYVNKIFEEVSGYSQEELLGKSHNIVKHPDMNPDIFKDLWKTIKVDKKPWFGKIKNRKKDGTPYYVDTVINPIFDESGDIIEFIAVRKDITEIMSQKKQMLDSLTHIKNPTLILIKISNFNFIKEFYPEKILKRFEREFALHLFKTLSSYLSIHKVYFLSNGLFAMVEDKQYTGNKLETYLNEILNDVEVSEFEFDNNKYELDLVFSYSFKSEHQYEDAISGIESMKKKHAIINANNYYEISKENAHGNLEKLTLLKNALKEEDKIVSFYQPIVDNETLEIVKYESLIRLIKKDEEILSPYNFMSIAKKTGYYHDITCKVIKNADKILSFNKKINISINLSSIDIEDIQVNNLLIQLISKDINKGRVTFELLEDEDTSDIKKISDFITFAKTMGDVKISIDDFGSGYSNYERLSLFQPDYIKIDGSLIKDIVNNKYNESVVKSILVFAKENNIKTIAEFVSSKEIYEKVKELGISYSQGYYFGKPEPILL